MTRINQNSPPIAVGFLLTKFNQKLGDFNALGAITVPRGKQ